MSTDGQTLTDCELRAIYALAQAQLTLGVSHVQGADLSELLTKLQLYGGEVKIGVANQSHLVVFTYGANKVAAIKCLRGATGLGLKESKDILDRAYRGPYDSLYSIQLQLTTRQRELLQAEVQIYRDPQMTVQDTNGESSWQTPLISLN